ncbi:hypothetical protein ABIA43_002059 [Bradyrhizobium sp. USDA 328]
MDPARMFKESLTPRPELENSQGHSRPGRASSKSGPIRYAPKAEMNSEHWRLREAVVGWWYAVTAEPARIMHYELSDLARHGTG